MRVWHSLVDASNQSSLENLKYARYSDLTSSGDPLQHILPNMQLALCHHAKLLFEQHDTFNELSHPLFLFLYKVLK